jgi:hypothetical protein
MNVEPQVWHVFVFITLAIACWGEWMVRYLNPYGGIGAKADAYVCGAICVVLILLLWGVYFSTMGAAR